MAELSYLYVTYIVDPPMLGIFYIWFVLMELFFLKSVYSLSLDVTFRCICINELSFGVADGFLIMLHIFRNNKSQMFFPVTTQQPLPQFSHETQFLWELKRLIISSQHTDLKSICGHSRRRERKSENIFNNLSHLMRLAEPLTQSWHGDTHR